MRSPVETRCAGVADMCMRRLYQKESRGRTTLQDFAAARRNAGEILHPLWRVQDDDARRSVNAAPAGVAAPRTPNRGADSFRSTVTLNCFQYVAVHYEGEDS